jgi:hypothetical protein
MTLAAAIPPIITFLTILIKIAAEDLNSNFSEILYPNLNLERLMTLSFASLIIVGGIYLAVTAYFMLMGTLISDAAGATRLLFIAKVLLSVVLANEFRNAIRKTSRRVLKG